MNERTVIATHDPCFELACHVFRRAGLATSPGSYLIHNKSRGIVKVGIGGGRRIALPLPAANGASDESAADLAVFEAANAELHAKVPYFFLVSPDFKRSYRDTNLPAAIFEEPRIELLFSVAAPHGEISFTRDPASLKEAQLMLTELLGDFVLPVRTALSNTPSCFAEVSAGWERTESDAMLLRRFDIGIRALKTYPGAKITMMRSFFRGMTESVDRFGIFHQQARHSGDYSFAHFYCLDAQTVSFGCSPENTFEIIGDELNVDVVASTCKSGYGEAYERRELFENPKQQKEHLATIEGRTARYSPFCESSQMRLKNPMQIKRLRNVCHLHSLLVGKLRRETTILDILPTLFPIMGAKPVQLLSLSDSETSPHRFYGGVVGHSEQQYVGSFLNIRNALVQGDTIFAKVGVGLIADSDAESELIETEDKISGLMEAVYRCCESADSL